jgi:hypothetical protein
MGFFDNPSVIRNMIQSLGGELVTGTPSGGIALPPIWAIVRREPPKELVEAHHGLAPWRSIEIAVSDWPVVTQDGDKFSILYRIGDAAPTVLLVKQIIAQDAGAWHLRLG